MRLRERKVVSRTREPQAVTRIATAAAARQLCRAGPARKARERGRDAVGIAGDCRRRWGLRGGREAASVVSESDSEAGGWAGEGAFTRPGASTGSTKSHTKAGEVTNSRQTISMEFRVIVMDSRCGSAAPGGQKALDRGREAVGGGGRLQATLEASGGWQCRVGERLVGVRVFEGVRRGPTPSLVTVACNVICKSESC